LVHFIIHISYLVWCLQYKMITLYRTPPFSTNLIVRTGLQWAIALWRTCTGSSTRASFSESDEHLWYFSNCILLIFSNVWRKTKEE
jgi:hypothetical protein